ncbi:FtsW/RodA/SpoVE family cell cycle protein [Myxococcota bacterium]
MSPTTLKQSTFNWGLVGATMAVAGLGLVNLYSASHGASTNMAFLQGLWLGVGVVIAVVLTVLDYRIFEQLAYPFLILTLVFLLAVLVIGRVISGSQRWINLGFMNFQPSEMAKISVILCMAKYFSDEPGLPAGGYRLRDLIKPTTVPYPAGAAGALMLFWEKLEFLGGWRFVLLVVFLAWGAASVLYALRTGRTSLHDMLSPIILVILPAILILRQPDLGTTLMLFAIAGTMILFVKVRFLSLVIAGVVFVVAAVGSWQFLQPYQKDRILAFISPSEDIKDSGYHSRQSMIAVGSGKTSGKGFGESTQTQFRFLPEQHTDFVFSVWAEEWGFTGCLVVLGVFLFWLVQMINVASDARERFGVLVAVGITAMIFWHVAINIGMVIGVLPVVGITLPLWSYGGSSVLAMMASLGLLMSVSLRRHAFT